MRHPAGQDAYVGLAQASFLRLPRRPNSRYRGQNPLIAVAAIIAAKIRATTPPAVTAPTAIASQTAATQDGPGDPVGAYQYRASARLTAPPVHRLGALPFSGVRSSW